MTHATIRGTVMWGVTEPLDGLERIQQVLDTEGHTAATLDLGNQATIVLAEVTITVEGYTHEQVEALRAALYPHFFHFGISQVLET